MMVKVQKPSASEWYFHLLKNILMFYAKSGGNRAPNEKANQLIKVLPLI
jgi:hypothetical protein